MVEQHNLLNWSGAQDKLTLFLPIFIICIEYRSRYIHFMSQQKKSGIIIKLNKDCPNIPYVMFANYLLIFIGLLKLRPIMSKYSRSLL